MTQASGDTIDACTHGCEALRRLLHSLPRHSCHLPKKAEEYAGSPSPIPFIQSLLSRRDVWSTS